MKLEMRYDHHPEDVKKYDTEALRRHFLVEQVFAVGELNLVYTHVDRVVFGGATPTTKPLSLEGGKEFGTENFLDRRELGIVNIAASGSVTLDGKKYSLANGDGLYVGMGTKSVVLKAMTRPSLPNSIWSAAPHTPPTRSRTLPVKKPIRANSARKNPVMCAPFTNTCILLFARAANW